MPNKPYILSRPSLSPSARLLSKNLGLERSNRPRDYAPTIRWGNSESEYGKETVYNIPQLIYTVAHKGAFSAAMSEKDIPHLKLFRGIPERFPVVIRQILTGTRGAGIHVCKSLEDFQRNYHSFYWTEWKNFSTEFGVHMLGGKVVKVMKKIRADGLQEQEFPIRNANLGYEFTTISSEKLPLLNKFMENIFEKFPMEFGRWDIGYERGKGYTVIEANSAPSLAQNENTLNLYVQFFKKILEKED